MVSIPARTAATATMAASRASMTAAAVMVSGRGGGVFAPVPAVPGPAAAGPAPASAGPGASAAPRAVPRVLTWASLALARARALDREPTRHLHDPAPPGCHRPRPGLRRRA